MNPEFGPVPYGILNVPSGLLTIFFGTSSETGDFIADCIEARLEADKTAYAHIFFPGRRTAEEEVLLYSAVSRSGLPDNPTCYL